MKTKTISSVRFWPWLAVAALCLQLLGNTAFGRGGSSVLYEPALKSVEGLIPYTYTYPLTVTSPDDYIPGTSSTISFNAQRNPAPAGATPAPVDDATMLGYVTFSPSSLTFTDASQAQTVMVTVSLPADAVGGFYGYQIYTAGWPSTIAYDDFGAAINLTATVGGVLTPPAVTISNPADATVITVQAGGLPIDVPFNFTVDSTDAGGSAITAVDADINGTAITLTTTGLGSTSATGSGSLHITAPGSYTVSARGTNLGGIGSDANTFTVKVSYPLPTVTIASPTPGSSYTYRAGDSPLNVPFTFTGSTLAGGIQLLTATLDGTPVIFSTTGLLSLSATGTAQLPFIATGAGPHQIHVTAIDLIGQIATADTNFTINYVAPTPTLTITTPTQNQQFTLPLGATTMNVPYTFVTTSNNGFVVNSVTATLGTTSVVPTTTGLGTASATSAGTLANLAAGTYTLTATGVSAGISVQQSVTFTIKGAQLPPSVVINSPAPGTVYTRVSGGPAVGVPLTFTGTSNTTGAVITDLQATLDGTSISITKTNIGQKVATGTATLSITTAGSHTITVVAKDAYGNATASTTFTVNIVIGRTVCGDVFFDFDGDGREDCSDFGLSGVSMKLVDGSNQVVATDVTDCGGGYSFSNIAPGTYTVSATTPVGLMATTPTTRSITVVNCNVWVCDIGFDLDFKALQAMTANGYTIGYWKNNIDKALAGKTNGTQVSKCTLLAYTAQISDLALCPYDCITMKSASSIMGSTSSRPADLLSKQLIASEYNYENSAYLNGNRNLTFLFISWGEYVLSHSCNYSSTYVLWAQSWFDAYNNSHGGIVAGPSP